MKKNNFSKFFNEQVIKLIDFLNYLNKNNHSRFLKEGEKYYKIEIAFMLVDGFNNKKYCRQKIDIYNFVYFETISEKLFYGKRFIFLGKTRDYSIIENNANKRLKLCFNDFAINHNEHQILNSFFSHEKKHYKL